VSLPNATFRCSAWRRSSASDFFRAFVSKYFSNACASVIAGFGFGAASSALNWSSPVSASAFVA
jgi:hypothetical protein